MSGGNVEKFKGVHFEAIAGVYDEQDEIGNLGSIDHGAEIGRDLNESKSALGTGNDGNGACDSGDRSLGIVLDKISDDGCFSDVGGPDNGNDAWWRDVSNSMEREGGIG